MALSNDQQAVAQRIAELEGIATGLRAEKESLNSALQENEAKVQAGIAEVRLSISERLPGCSFAFLSTAQVIG